jgi:hypothetical protein
MEDEARPYTVAGEAGRFTVRDETGRVIMVCGDESSATNYAVLVNEAYQRGVRVGYRRARESLRHKTGGA